MKTRFSMILITILCSEIVVAKKLKDRDYLWICASDDDSRGVFVDYPSRGAPKVQVALTPGGEVQNMLSTAEIDEESNELRFNFNNFNTSFIIQFGERPKKMGNVYFGGLYDFSDLEDESDTVDGITFICAEKT